MSAVKEYVSSSMLQIAAAVFPIVVAAAIGSWATASSLTDWYPQLIKPAINPPDWLFGPAWTALYLLMAYAGWRILRISAASPGRHTAMVFFYGQLALNASWPCLFFGLHNPIAGLIDIVPQWLLILATIRHFRRLDVIAALCLVPLAFWVGFAAILNFEIWRLNG